MSSPRLFFGTHSQSKQMNREQQTKSNFLWNVGYQAATMKPFVFANIADQAGYSVSDRKPRRDTQRCPKSPKNSEFSLSSSQLIASNLLLKKTVARKLDSSVDINISSNTTSSKQYTNAEFLNYANLLLHNNSNK